jgi:Leucine-rich repeat (LRR) protein
MFEEYQPLVERLVGVQRQLATQYLADAKTLITEGNRLIEAGNKKDGQEKLDQGFLSLYRSHKALPKNKPLIKYLSEEGIKAGMLKTEEIYMENNNRRMPECIEPLYFVVDEKLNSCDLTDKGTGWLAKQVNDAELFVLPDITSQLSALEAETGLSDQDVGYLQGLQSLGTLNVTDNPGLTARGLDALRTYVPGCMVTHSDVATDVDFDGRMVPSDTRELRLAGQNITDITGVQNLNELQTVDLSVNMISNIYPFIFADCRYTVTNLNLSYNNLSDLTPLSMMPNLQELDLSFNQISSLQPLMNLTNLRSLRLSGNPLSVMEINALAYALPNCEVVF